MNLEIRHLKLIAAIADTGSMTRAGNRLHLTQSALSHQLRDAEETLGTRLFVRQRGKMTLTAPGERLLRSARAVIEELDRAEKEIRDTNGSVNAERGLIRLSTECYTVYHWLPPRLKMFQQKFPSVEFELVVEATDYPYESLLNGELDVAIVCDPPRNRRIRYTPLFEDEMVVIVSPEHRMARKEHAVAAHRQIGFEYVGALSCRQRVAVERVLGAISAGAAADWRKRAARSAPRSSCRPRSS